MKLSTVDGTFWLWSKETEFPVRVLSRVVLSLIRTGAVEVEFRAACLPSEDYRPFLPRDYQPHLPKAVKQ